MRVLAFGAHPDDIEFRCGGTLARYAENGDEIFMAVATNGNIGSFRHTKEQIAEIRRKEAQAAADVIGAKLIWMNYNDEFLFDNAETRLAFIDAVRIAQPDVVFAPPYYRDYNPDHDVTGYLAFIARINASIKLIETEHKPISTVPPLFFCTSHQCSNFIPEYYVDITSTFETKKKMFLCHDSQQGDWCRDAFGVAYMDGLERENKFLASQCGSPGCEYAEGFQICKSWPIKVGAHKLLP